MDGRRGRRVNLWIGECLTCLEKSPGHPEEDRAMVWAAQHCLVWPTHKCRVQRSWVRI